MTRATAILAVLAACSSHTDAPVPQPAVPEEGAPAVPAPVPSAPAHDDELDRFASMLHSPRVPRPATPKACELAHQTPATGALAGGAPLAYSPLALNSEGFAFERIVSLEPYVTEGLDAKFRHAGQAFDATPGRPFNKYPLYDRGTPAIAARLDARKLEFGEVVLSHDIAMRDTRGPELGLTRGIQLEEILIGDLPYFHPGNDVDRSGLIVAYRDPAWVINVFADGHADLWDGDALLDVPVAPTQLDALMKAFGASSFDRLPLRRSAIEREPGSLVLVCARLQAVAIADDAAGLAPILAVLRQIRASALAHAEPTLWAQPIGRIVAWPPASPPLTAIHLESINDGAEKKLGAAGDRPIPRDVADAIHAGRALTSDGNQTFALRLLTCTPEGIAKLGCVPSSYALLTRKFAELPPAWPKLVALSAATSDRGAALPADEHAAARAFYDSLARTREFVQNNVIYRVRSGLRVR